MYLQLNLLESIKFCYLNGLPWACFNFFGISFALLILFNLQLFTRNPYSGKRKCFDGESEFYWGIQISVKTYRVHELKKFGPYKIFFDPNLENCPNFVTTKFFVSHVFLSSPSKRCNFFLK